MTEQTCYICEKPVDWELSVTFKRQRERLLESWEYTLCNKDYLALEKMLENMKAEAQNETA